MVTTQRHMTVEKSKSKNRPYHWTQKQRQAHHNPIVAEAYLIIGEKPKEMIDQSLNYKLNMFLVNVSYLTIGRKNIKPNIPQICNIFMRIFKTYKVNRERLFSVLNSYCEQIFKANEANPFPVIFQETYYVNRRKSFETLRKDGVKELKSLMEIVDVECEKSLQI